MILVALHALAGQVPADSIDELWIFPTRRSGQSESTVVVASAFVPGDDERRRIITAHCSTRPEPGKRKPVSRQTIAEQGVAPAELVGRLVDGVMRRLDEELAALAPRAIQIGGKGERWDELLAELTGATEQAAAPEGSAPAAPPAGSVSAPGSPAGSAPGSTPSSAPGPQPSP